MQTSLERRFEETESVFTSISSSLMNERVDMCNSEKNLTRRLYMFERLKTQVAKASVPYINFLIMKTKKKIEDERGVPHESL